MTDQLQTAAAGTLDAACTRRRLLRGVLPALALAAAGSGALAGSAAAARGKGKTKKDRSGRGEDGSRDGRRRGRNGGAPDESGKDEGRRPAPAPAPAPAPDPAPAPSPVPAPTLAATYRPMVMDVTATGRHFPPGATMQVEIFGDWSPELGVYLFQQSDTVTIDADGMLDWYGIAPIPCSFASIDTWDFEIRVWQEDGPDVTAAIYCDIWAGW